MNSASQNLPHHLGVLRERMLHPTDYELAVAYFLEEFAGDAAFLGASEGDDAPQLFPVLEEVASKALKQAIAFDGKQAFVVREHGFYHGNAVAAGRVVLFFYFQDADAGVAAFIPGVRGEMEVARFRVVGGASDPKWN